MLLFTLTHTHTHITHGPLGELLPLYCLVGEQMWIKLDFLKIHSVQLHSIGSGEMGVFFVRKEPKLELTLVLLFFYFSAHTGALTFTDLELQI